MPRSIAVPVYIGLMIAAIFLAHSIVYYVSPIIAWLHPVVRFLSGFAACLSLLIVAYQFAIKNFDGTTKIAIWSTSLWIVLAMTSPAIERQENWSVQGLVGDGYEKNEITLKIRCHCRPDAIEIARTLYKDHRNWPRQYAESVDGVTPSEVPKTDVMIECFTTTPSLDWLNSLLGTHLGTEFYTTTLRFLENGEDPLNIIMEPYSPESSYDDEQYQP